jgi:hypothetical protein
MSKLDELGNPIYREDGKVMKGPNYFKPDFLNWVNNKLEFGFNFRVLRFDKSLYPYPEKIFRKAISKSGNRFI